MEELIKRMEKENVGCSTLKRYYVEFKELVCLKKSYDKESVEGTLNGLQLLEKIDAKYYMILGFLSCLYENGHITFETETDCQDELLDLVA